MRIAVLTSRNAHQYALLRALAREHEVALAAFDNVAGRKPRLLRRRMEKLGPLRVADQLLFKALDLLLFQRRARARRRDILGEAAQWPGGELGQAEILEVESLNTPAFREKIVAADPELVVVSGAGILGAKLIQALRPRPIINIHCGVTPRYRGTHGAFWAVVNGDWENVGVTLHYLDEGIDTGGIIAQGRVRPAPDDNPRTLVLKQYREGIALLLGLLERIESGQAPPLIERPDLDSRLYSSPTFSAWLKFRRNLKSLSS